MPGRVEYKRAWELQKQVQARIIAAKQSAHKGVEAGNDSAERQPPHVLMLLEHPHVFTLGKSGKVTNLLSSKARLQAMGATFQHIDRGGDVTYHGPGQLVGYPILDLSPFFTDVHRYLRTLEEVIIRTCADYGIGGRRVDGRTGVWVGGDGSERKICALGIRCSRWGTMHGFAFNLNTDLSRFDHIVPCGIADREVTSLAVEVGEAVNESAVRERLIGHFGEAFGADMVSYPCQDIDELLPENLETPQMW